VSAPGRTLWCDLTSLTRHVGTVSGIQRAVSGLVAGLLEETGDGRLAFCHFDKQHGFLALERDRVVELLASFGSAEKKPERTERRRGLGARLARPAFGAPFAAGDLLFNAGFATYKPKQHAMVAELFAARGVRYVGFVYDLLPVAFPEWWTPDQQERFGEWFRWSGRHAALLLCCSESTRRDAQRFFAAERITPGAIETIALADELPRRLAAARAAQAPDGAERRPFVLYVSTLEVRKNHRLLFQVWRRLLERHPTDAIPELVLVGRRGWLIDDFLAEASNARWLDGKIVWRDGVGDDELVRLYGDCLFTVYPSLYEGWGLPVAEALAFGKFCVASNTSSLPEVGREWIDYHDPHDVAGATAQIERAIFEPGYRERRERAIREGFRARSWRESAAALLAALDRVHDSGKSSAR
jgi:glycosyltransferase involved in cell wall biosynthesis